MVSGNDKVLKSNIVCEIPETEITTSKPEENFLPEISRQNFVINSTPRKYTYDNLVQDIEKIQDIYGSMIQVQRLCNTIDDRIVYDVVLGDPSGENQILIFGAMHAREYITSQVVMRQLCATIDALNGYGVKEYKGIPIKELLKDVTIHFIPMSNPDGVAISQFGLAGIRSEMVQNKIKSMNVYDYEQWKSNAAGVDLNRNFDADWDSYVGTSKPSSERYKGISPGSEVESSALIRLTQNCNIKRTISYHTCGAVIYWYYKQSGDLLEESRKFASDVSNETGYYLDADYSALDPAGYKDWAVYKMHIPSLTIEVGDENGYWNANPVPIECFNEIWNRNKNVVYATVYNLKYE